MIQARRIAGVIPASLFKKFRDGRTELDRAVAHYITDGKSGSYDFDRYRSADVKRALDEIFHGKCAYCESFYAKTQPVDVEHYRPKGKVDGDDDHRGYWWLAMDWENLLPSCIDCNRKRGQRTPRPDQQATMVALNDNSDFARGKDFNTGKQSAFPLDTDSPRARWDDDATKDIDLARERRLLLDPTRDNPDDHLVFFIDRSKPDEMLSIVYPKPLAAGEELILPVLGGPDAVAANAGENNISAAGAVSIQVYGLNRLSLVQARTKLLRDLEFLFEISVSLQTLKSEVETRMTDRTDRIDRAQGDAQAALENDQILDQRITAQITDLRDKIIGQMTAQTESTAQFSALAKAWMATLVTS